MAVTKSATEETMSIRKGGGGKRGGKKGGKKRGAKKSTKKH